MDNVTEIERNEDPRRGIAPFAGGIEEEQGKDSQVTYIKYKEFSLGDVGKFSMRLDRPYNDETLELTTNSDDLAYTIDLTGKIQRGNLRDFLNAGYYEVFLLEEMDPELNIQNDQYSQELKVNLWIDNTNTAISSPLMGGYLRDATFLRRVDEKKPILEHFVLPNDPAILQAVRLNITSDEK